MKYKINIWQYHNIIDTYENDKIEEVLKWYEENYKWTYEMGNCSFDVLIDNEALTFEQENELGFYK